MNCRFADSRNNGLGLAIDHALEWFDERIGHAEPTVEVANHRVNTPIARVLQRVKDGPIEGLPHPKHGPLTGADDRAIAGDKVLERLMFPINACNKPWKG